MKLQTNKAGKISSLLRSIGLILMYTIVFSVGILWFLQTIKVDGLLAAFIASQLSIALLALAFFKFNTFELLKLMELKVKFKNVLLTVMSIFIIMSFNMLIGAVINGLDLNKGNFTSQTTESLMNNGNLFLMIIIPIIVAPIFEELAFRAGLKKALVDDSTWKPYQYAIISGILFGLMHFQPGPLAFVPIIITGFIGFINSILYLKTKSIFYPIICHMSYNLIILYAALNTI